MFNTSNSSNLSKLHTPLDIIKHFQNECPKSISQLPNLANGIKQPIPSPALYGYHDVILDEYKNNTPYICNNGDLLTGIYAENPVMFNLKIHGKLIGEFIIKEKEILNGPLYGTAVPLVSMNFSSPTIEIIEGDAKDIKAIYCLIEDVQLRRIVATNYYRIPFTDPYLDNKPNNFLIGHNQCRRELSINANI